MTRALGAWALLLALMLAIGPVGVASAEEPDGPATTPAPASEEAAVQLSEQAPAGQPAGEGAAQSTPETQQPSAPAGEPGTTASPPADEPGSESSSQEGKQEPATSQEQITIQAPETPVSVEVPGVTPPQEVVAPTEVPSVEQVKQVLSETLTPETHIEKSPESSTPESNREHVGEGLGSVLSSSSSSSSSTIASPASTPIASTPIAAGEQPTTSTTPATQDPTQLLEGPETGVTSQSVHRKAAEQLAEARRSGSLSCELSALEGEVSSACTTTQSTSTPPSVDSLYITAVARATASANGAHAEGSGVEDNGDGGRPAAPTPGPAPGGAAGGAAGAGSAGGLSGFLTRADMHLRFTPRAMRRLKLAQLPWRTAFFVLIPERPG